MNVTKITLRKETTYKKMVLNTLRKKKREPGILLRICSKRTSTKEVLRKVINKHEIKYAEFEFEYI